MSVSAYHQHHHHNHHHNNHNNNNHNNNNGHNNKREQRFKDSRALRELKVKQNKHILSTYNKAYAFFPKVCAQRTEAVNRPARSRQGHSTQAGAVSLTVLVRAALSAGQVCAQAQQPHGRGLEAVWQRQ